MNKDPKSWQNTMPVWAHQQLWLLRDCWSGPGRPSGRIIRGHRRVYPVKLHEDLGLLPAADVYVVLMATPEGNREYILWRDNGGAVLWGEYDNDGEPKDWPEDVITGYPDHYIINGDPMSCGCDEHQHLSQEFIHRQEEDIR